jgi:AcrR family transcriptional regulator
MFEKTPNSRHSFSKRERAKETYESLLKAALDIIHEKGIEALNSNAVVAAIGSTPPTFYRYFADKHEVLEILGNRLMDLRSELLTQALKKRYDDYETSYQNIYTLLSDTLERHRNTPGTHSLLLSLRALPDLKEIRTNTQEKMTQLTVASILKDHPNLDKNELCVQVRLAMEIGYSAIEILFETDFENIDITLDHTTRAILRIYDSFIN